jgi:PAS domain S-box-containing protein
MHQWVMANGFAGSPVILSYTVVHILTTVLSLSVAVYTARTHWHKPLGQAFTLLLVSASIWTTGSLVRLFTSTPDGFIAVSTFKYVGIVTAPVLFVLFALIYDGKTQWVTRRVIATLLVVPAVTVLVVGTTQLHGLFYSDYTTTAIDNLTVLSIQTVGQWYWLYVVYGWGLVAIGSGLLIHAGIKRSRFYRVQLLVLLPAIVISWMTNILYVGWSWPHPALDPTPIGFAVTCLLLGFGLFSTQLVEVSPAARSLVFEVIDDAVIVLNGENRVVDVNRAAQPLLADTDPVGEELSTILVADIAQQIAARPDTVELDEESTTQHYQYRELSIESGEEQVLVFTDITERKERERELEQFREAVEQTAHAVYITDADGTIEYVNQAFEENTGFSEEEAIGANPRILQSGEYDEEYYEEFWETILSGEQWEDEIIDQRADGEQIVMEQTIAPITDEDGRPQRFVAVAQDITERKEHEQLLETQRDSLEVLNQVVRHDIRNDLQVVLGYVNTLEEYVEEDGEEYLRQIQKASQDAVDITMTAQEVTEMLLMPDADLAPVSLGRELEREINDVRSSHSDAVITVDEQLPDVKVMADNMLNSIFRNLLKNAIVHNDKSVPKVTVTTERSDGMVGVTIADNGPGIPDDLKEKIFEKGSQGLGSEGTGLGLYLVDTLVDRYGGDVRVKDNDPEGTVFVVSLPVAE